MNTLTRREALTGLASLLGVSAIPNPALAAVRDGVRSKMPDFSTYENSRFGRKEHEMLHRKLEADFAFAKEPNLTRWNSNPDVVYVNEKAGESIHITGVNLEENYVEMIWVLAPAYTNSNGERVYAHVPFEHEHSNQSEEFEKIQGEVSAQVNGILLDDSETDFFTAEAKDDHIAWNPSEEPLAMRVRYAPGFGKDGELALMVYWGLVNDATRTGAQGQPKNFALLGALNSHLAPKALASSMPAFLPEVVEPFLVNPLNRQEVRRLYTELTGEMHPRV